MSDDYYRSRSRDRDRDGRTLIFEGLPDDATEKDVLDGLEIVAQWSEFESDMIRSVRLKYNRRGYRVAFVDFFRSDDASDFLHYHPEDMGIPLTGSRGIHSEPVDVRINMSTERDREEFDQDDREDDWSCYECGAVNYPNRRQCYKCRSDRRGGHDSSQGGRGRSSTSKGPILTGETDECPQQIPSYYLVVRGLDSSVTEETLAKGITKLFVEGSAVEKSAPPPPPASGPPTAKLKSTAPVANTSGLGAKSGSLRRVFLMRDRRTDDSWKFGFAEFATLEDAQGAMAKYRASHRFTIGSKTVGVAFIHTGVFVPALDEVIPDRAHFVFSPVYNPGIHLKYWDNRGYPSIHNVNFTQPEPAPGGNRDSDNPTKSEGAPAAAAAAAAGAGHSGQDKKPKKSKDKDKDKDKQGLVMAPQMQMWAKKRAELHGVSAAAAAAAGMAAAAADMHGGSERGVFGLGGDKPRTGLRAAHWRDSYVSYADWDNLHCLLCDKRCRSTQDLRDHEVLSKNHEARLQDPARKEGATARLAELAKQPQTLIRRRPRDRAESALVYTSYADPDRRHCLICQRRFRALGTLRLHERESEIHRKNMTNEKNIDRATAALARAGRRPVKLRPAPPAALRYRDRARERRVAFNQPRMPSSSAAVKRRRDDAAAPKPDEPPPKKPAPSKGASLLGKMGWTAGQGLGADGSGLTEAIQTDLYAPGVGLGAEGGKVGDAAEEAAKKTSGNGYSDFVEKTRDKARQRYERLN